MTDKNIFSSHHWHSADPNADELTIHLTQTSDLRLQVKNNFGVRIAEMAGEPIIQYNDIDIADDADLTQMRSKLLTQLKQNQVGLLHFHNVKIGSNLYRLMQNIGENFAPKQAPYIDMSGFKNLNDFLQSLSPNTRKSKRRAFKKLENNFTVKFTSLIDDQISTALFDKVIKLKADQLKRLGLTSRLFTNFSEIAKLRDIVSNPNKDFQCVFSLLECDGKIAAAEIGYTQNQIYYSFLGAMDDEFANFSPGSCQLLKTIDWALQNKIQIFDFLPPEDNYKFSWTANQSNPVCDIILPLGFKGKYFAGLYVKTIRPLLKKAYIGLKSRQN